MTFAPTINMYSCDRHVYSSTSKLIKASSVTFLLITLAHWRINNQQSNFHCQAWKRSLESIQTKAYD